MDGSLIYIIYYFLMSCLKKLNISGFKSMFKYYRIKTNIRIIHIYLNKLISKL